MALIIHIPSLSSPLLLRISPHTFAFIPIPSMYLSSLNRSIYAVFRHIMPYSAPLCKVLHYSKTGVPWHTKSIFIIVLVSFQTSLNLFKLPVYRFHLIHRFTRYNDCICSTDLGPVADKFLCSTNLILDTK